MNCAALKWDSNSEKAEAATAYYKLTLVTEDLPEKCFQRLETLGLQCISQGQPYEIFGIGPDSEQFMEELKKVRGVKEVEHSDPPTGM